MFLAPLFNKFQEVRVLLNNIDSHLASLEDFVYDVNNGVYIFEVQSVLLHNF